MTNTVIPTVTGLAAMRHELLDIFNRREVDDAKIDSPEFQRITAVEKQIENATYETEADRRIGNLILSENRPSLWDDFQENLFLRMQQFA
jgi:hypothetical protein